MKRSVRTILVVTFAASLAGCGISLIDTQPAPEIYDLGAPSMSEGGEVITWQLIVEEPSAIRALGTNRVALKRGGNAILYYKGARWSDRGPNLIQARLIEALEDTGRIMSVGGETSGINARYRLKTNLRVFHAEVNGGATAVVGLSVQLLDVHTRKIVATTLVEKRVKAHSGKIGDVVTAFDEAAQEAIRDIADWVLEAGEIQSR